MGNKITRSLLLGALLLAVTAIIYNAVFAGIPYQDPSREQLMSYARHSRVSAVIMFASAGLGLSALFSAACRKFARRKP